MLPYWYDVIAPQLLRRPRRARRRPRQLAAGAAHAPRRRREEDIAEVNIPTGAPRSTRSTTTCASSRRRTSAMPKRSPPRPRRWPRRPADRLTQQDARPTRDIRLQSPPMASKKSYLEHLRRCRCSRRAVPTTSRRSLGRATNGDARWLGDRRSGTDGREAFVILDGTALVKRNNRRSPSSVRAQSSGELSLLDHGPRTATVVAETDSRCS